MVAFAPLSNFADMLGSRLARFELAGEHGGARANWRLVHARVRVSGWGMLSFALQGSTLADPNLTLWPGGKGTLRRPLGDVLQP